MRSPVQQEADVMNELTMSSYAKSAYMFLPDAIVVQSVKAVTRM